MNKALMVISLLVLLCFTFSCQQAGEGITEEEAKVLFNKGYEMWNEGNMDIVDEIIAPEYYNGFADSDQNESQFKVYLLTIN